MEVKQRTHERTVPVGSPRVVPGLNLKFLTTKGGDRIFWREQTELLGPI